jgi:hypothetical protein
LFLSLSAHVPRDGEASSSALVPAKVDCENLGHLRMTIDMTPDHMAQSHRFIFDIDQSYLPVALDGCWEILRRFPIKGSPT